MVCCGPFSEVATANVAEVEDVDKAASAAMIAWTIGENPAASDGEGCLSSLDAADDSLGKGASNDENSRTYYFQSLTITGGKIMEMVEKGYFIDGEARAPGAEIVLELDNDEAVVYEDFFVAGLRMPRHPTLADILLKIQT
jgi:hypothetical protein